MAYVGWDEDYLCSFESATEFKRTVKSIAPLWRMVITPIRYDRAEPKSWEDSSPISYCPFCATAVPQLQRAEDSPKKFMVIADGGYYCATCKERLQCCECANPVTLWHVAP